MNVVRSLCILVLGLGSSGLNVVASEQRTISIVGASVIHPERELPDAIEPNTTIVIRNARIEAIGQASDVSIPAGSQVINARGKWVVPGLIDSHVHFFLSGNYYTRPDIADFTAAVPYAQEVARNKARLPETFRTWIASGVTSVIDVGGPMWTFEVRAQAESTARAPRVAVSGPLISTIARPMLNLGDPPIVKVATPEEARALVQRIVRDHPDYIKMWFVYTRAEDLASQEAIAKATADAAHAGGARFAVHATELVTAKAALRAGADLLVHSVMDEEIDGEFLSLAKQRGALYCPTLFVMEGYGLALSGRWQPTRAEQRLADPEVLGAMDDLSRLPDEKIPRGVRRMVRERNAAGTSQASFSNLRKVAEAGITVVMGSDAGNIGTLHGPAIFREMQMMVDAGLTPLEVLRAATTNGAKAMKMEGEIGIIAPGKLADLVLLNADPLRDIGNASQVHLVIKEGKIVSGSPLKRVPETH